MVCQSGCFGVAYSGPLHEQEKRVCQMASYKTDLAEHRMYVAKQWEIRQNR